MRDKVSFKKEVATGKFRCRSCPSQNKVSKGNDIYHISCWVGFEFMNIYLCRKHAEKFAESIAEELRLE